MTQFGRALAELNVEPKVRVSDIICASTPQAKGRVERANRTLQDRLVKKLRLEGIATIKDANAFAPRFIEQLTTRDYPDGRPEIEWRGVALPHQRFDKLQRVQRAPIVENKRLIDRYHSRKQDRAARRHLRAWR